MARQATSRAAFVVLSLGTFGGCAATRSTVTEPLPAPPAVVDSAQVEAWNAEIEASRRADSTLVASDTLSATARRRPPRAHAAPRTASDTLRASAPDTAGGPSESPLTGAASIGISVELGAEEAAELRHQIAQDLDHAEASLRGVNRAQLASEDQVRLETAQGLIQDAREERAAGDLRAAGTLARKARLLAEELTAE